MAKRELKRGFKLTAGAGVPLVGSGSLGFEKNPSDSGSQTSERIYDPLWANARALLDYLSGAELISRDIKTATLGQFVIASGDLSVFNAAMLPKVWEAPGVRDQAITNAVTAAKATWNATPQNVKLSKNERDRAEKLFLKTIESSTRAGLDVLPHLPHSSQCIIRGEGFSVWSILIAEGMVGTIADLSLKHGTEIPGTWHLLGVLDALPSPIPDQIPIASTGAARHSADLIRNYANLARTIVGRPPESFGMTPLLLFREVSGRPVAS